MEFVVDSQTRNFEQLSGEIFNYPNQEGTMKKQDEIFSSVGEHHMNTSDYQLSDLEDIEFHWEDPDLNLDAVIRPGIDSQLPLPTFNDFEVGSKVENPILIE